MQISRRLHKHLWKTGNVDKLGTTELMILWKLHKCGTMRASDISTAIGIPASTLTGIIDRLVAHEYVERSASTDDRRSVVLAAGTKTVSLMNSAQNSLNSTLKTVFVSFTAEQRSRLADDLQAVLDGLDQEETK